MDCLKLAAAASNLPTLRCALPKLYKKIGWLGIYFSASVKHASEALSRPSLAA